MKPRRPHPTQRRQRVACELCLRAKIDSTRYPAASEKMLGQHHIANWHQQKAARCVNGLEVSESTLWDGAAAPLLLPRYSQRRLWVPPHCYEVINSEFSWGMMYTSLCHKLTKQLLGRLGETEATDCVLPSSRTRRGKGNAARWVSQRECGMGISDHAEIFLHNAPAHRPPAQPNQV